MIGHKAGYNETGSNKLYIANGDTISPLIHGDFSSGEVTINGNLTVNTLKDSSGNSMLRKVGNVVHIGVNSFTIEDASTSSSGKDEIASSINELQIGTSASHNTTVLGTLSVQTPTSDNHTTNKAYVDTATNSNATNITSNISNISTNTNWITSNGSNITTNTNSINSINTTNTTQDSLISTNTSNTSQNTSSINTIQSKNTTQDNSISINNNSITNNGNSINTNTGNITSNNLKVTAIQSKNTIQDTFITTNSSNITNNASSISTNSGNISTNVNTISSLQADDAIQDNAITTNAANINNNTNSVTSNTTSINSHTNSINANIGLIGINIDKISDMETGLAQSMAMSALVQPPYGKSNFSIAAGNYNGTSAIAYGFSHHDSDQDITYRLLGSQSNNISSSAASIGWGF
jgi:hypothetical protein